MFRPLLACFFLVAFGQLLEVQARLKAAVEEANGQAKEVQVKDLQEKKEDVGKKASELQEAAGAPVKPLPAAASNNLLNHGRLVKRAAPQEQEEGNGQNQEEGRKGKERKRKKRERKRQSE